jgi:peptidoglycan/xylan/chitin deacetylase (PgdA/CDA1 family)
MNRRELLAAAAAAAVSGSRRRRARIAVTLDLEMSRNFPTWETTHWDYEKGNLNEETKRYAVEACRRVKRFGGTATCFVVGRVLEQENVDWLREIAREGHAIGNHTYDHVNVKARTRDEIQYRFQRAPWLIEGKSPAEVIRENIRLTQSALKARIGVEPVGFRTPGGFADGLSDRPDVREMLRASGFAWVSSKYPAHPTGEADLDAIVKAQAEAQPFAYPDGLVEIPMSPPSDIAAFRNGRWKLEVFLAAIRRAVAWTIESGAVFDFLGHPSCLYVVDPEFRAIDLVCELARAAGDRAALVDLGEVAREAGKR